MHVRNLVGYERDRDWDRDRDRHRQTETERERNRRYEYFILFIFIKFYIACLVIANTTTHHAGVFAVWGTTVIDYTHQHAYTVQKSCMYNV